MASPVRNILAGSALAVLLAVLMAAPTLAGISSWKVRPGGCWADSLLPEQPAEARKPSNRGSTNDAQAPRPANVDDSAADPEKNPRRRQRLFTDDRR